MPITLTPHEMPKLLLCLFNFIKITERIEFHAIGFYLSNGVTDTLESSTTLLYLETHMGLYTQNQARYHTD